MELTVGGTMVILVNYRNAVVNGEWVMRYFLSLVFLLSSTLAYAQSSKAIFPAPSELYEGILALSCMDDDPTGDPPETLIITETNG
ncbi:hypothetical protein OAE27_01210, partial [bacterium]|nr:hypothetical protein [bacterium]